MVLPATQMYDQLNDLLDEFQPVQPNNVALTDGMKVHYLNMGQAAMWPRIYRMAEYVESIIVDQNEYPMPGESAIGRLVHMDLDLPSEGTRFLNLNDSMYDIIPGNPDILRLRGNPSDQMVGGTLRRTFAMPLIPLFWGGDGVGLDNQDFSGPDYAIEGPVLYAMNRITARGLHSRLDYGRQSVDFNNRSAVPNELMASSIFWLDEFERRVDQWQLVHPQSVM